MEVTHLTDQITHAVIGGAKAIDFGMSDSPEMMHILSSALYTDQILAVVRETMCNAWDAHIEAGCTDKPVEVTLTHDKLIIRDFGPGIHKDMIGPVYGTYGGTTKRKNGNVTGGFGLGCKAPFAYGDHFEVTSMHKHEKTIYQLSKSNAEVGGKPSILPLMTIATTESGIQVSMDIKEIDQKRFHDLLLRVCYNGEIKANINGKLAECMPFSKMENNFLISNHKHLDTNQRIMVRYGNVIYPVENHAEFGKEFNAIGDMLNKLPQVYNLGAYKQYKIVFQAAPNSISVTPSREALSMSAHTVKTLKDIFKNFVVEAEQRIKDKSYELLKERTTAAWLDGNPSKIISDITSLPNWKRRETESILYSLNSFATTYISYTHYPQYTGFKETDIRGRFNALIESGFGDTKQIMVMRDQWLRTKSDPSYKPNWFGKSFLWPILKAMEKEDEISKDKLFVYGRNKANRWGDKECNFADASNLIPRQSILEFMPFLRKVMILTFNRRDISRASQFSAFKHWFGDIKETLVYITPRVPRKVEAARAFWTKLGYHIVDLTMAQKWEHASVVEPEVRIISSRPKKVGIAALSSMMDQRGDVNTLLAQTDDAARIEKPEFIIKFARKDEKTHLDNLTKKATKDIIRLWGATGGIVLNSNQEEKYKNLGAESFVDFAYKKIVEQFKTNPRIRAYYPFDFTRHKDMLPRNGDQQDLFLAIYSDPILAEYLGFKVELTEDDKAYLNLLKELKASFQYICSKTIIEELEEEIKKLPLSPLVDKHFRIFRDNRLLNCLRTANVLSVMTSEESTTKQKEMLRDLLLEIIEG